MLQNSEVPSLAEPGPGIVARGRGFNSCRGHLSEPHFASSAGHPSRRRPKVFPTRLALAPPRPRRLPCGLGPLFRRHLCGASLTAFESAAPAQGDGERVLASLSRLFYNAGSEDVHVLGGFLA